jgi:hypothetical protein
MTKQLYAIQGTGSVIPMVRALWQTQFWLLCSSCERIHTRTNTFTAQSNFHVIQLNSLFCELILFLNKKRIFCWRKDLHPILLDVWYMSTRLHVVLLCEYRVSMLETYYVAIQLFYYHINSTCLVPRMIGCQEPVSMIFSYTVHERETSLMSLY